MVEHDPLTHGQLRDALLARGHNATEVAEAELALDAAVNMAWNEIRHRAQIEKHYGQMVIEVTDSSAGIGEALRHPTGSRPRQAAARGVDCARDFTL